LQGTRSASREGYTICGNISTGEHLFRMVPS